MRSKFITADILLRQIVDTENCRVILQLLRDRNQEGFNCHEVELDGHVTEMIEKFETLIQLLQTIEKIETLDKRGSEEWDLIVMHCEDAAKFRGRLGLSSHEIIAPTTDAIRSVHRLREAEPEELKGANRAYMDITGFPVKFYVSDK